MAGVHPAPPWEYSTVTGYAQLLAGQVEGVLRDLREKKLDASHCCADTRSSHKRFFDGLTPPGYSHYAGNYRGANLPGLLECWVTFGMRSGAPPADVAARMDALGERVVKAVAALDALHAGDASQELKLSRSVTVVAAFFGPFLATHPYVNGNGHMARFITFALLGRYGYWTNNWTVDPRPTTKHYTDLSEQAIDGKNGELVQHIFRCIKNPAVS